MSPQCEAVDGCLSMTLTSSAMQASHSSVADVGRFDDDSLATILGRGHYALVGRGPRGLAYFDSGDAGPVVLFAHGVGSSGGSWQHLFSRLPGWRLVAGDMRGHGRSGTPPPPYTLTDLADDQIKLIDAVGVDKVHFVGFSIGALIGQAVALARPDRIASLTLLSGIAGRTVTQRTNAEARLLTIRSSAPADVARGSVDRWFSAAFQASSAALAAEEVQRVSRVDPTGYAGCYEVLATYDLVDRLAEIDVPTLIATGEFDGGSTPAMSRRMKSLIPDSRLKIVPSANHYIQVEAADHTAELLRAFVESIDTRRGSRRP